MTNGDLVNGIDKFPEVVDEVHGQDVETGLALSFKGKHLSGIFLTYFVCVNYTTIVIQILKGM